ncbi:MAG: hypothetical protein H5T76_05510 [Streptomyces sp.]|nr:hypothetical protein [Streptomyces sp.]
MRRLPPEKFCPDFLTPPNTGDLDAGLDELLYTPKSFLRRDLKTFARFGDGPLPAWARSLADGSPRALETVGRAVRDWHRTAIAPVRRHLHTRAHGPARPPPPHGARRPTRQRGTAPHPVTALRRPTSTVRARSKRVGDGGRGAHHEVCPTGRVPATDPVTPNDTVTPKE